MEEIVGISLTSLSLLGLCFNVSRFFQWQLEDTPLFVVSSIIILLYLATWIGILALTAKSLFLLGLFSLLFFVKPTVNFIFMLLFLCLAALTVYHSHLLAWDEFAQWAPHSLLLFLHHNFINANDFTAHPAYPPGASLFHYFFFQITGYSEHTAYLAQLVMLISPLFILMSHDTGDDWQTSFITVCTILFSIALIFHVAIAFQGNLYMDSIVGIYFGMIIVYYSKSKKTFKDILYLIPSVMALSLFKLQLFPFILVITVLFFIYLLCLKHSFTWHSLLALVLLPFSFLITLFSWNSYLKIAHIPNEWSLALAHSSATNHIIIQHFIKALTLPLTYTLIILSVILMMVVTKTYSRKHLFILHGALFIASCLYLFGLLLMYLFAFNRYEGMILTSFSRYVSIFYLGWFLILLSQVLPLLKQKLKNHKIIKNNVIILFLSFMSVFSISYAVKHSKQRGLVLKLNQVSQKIINLTNANSSINIIWQNSNGFETTVLRYQLLPRRVIILGSVSQPYEAHDIWTTPLSLWQLKDQIKQADFLLLAHTDPRFWQQFSILFPPLTTLHSLTSMTQTYLFKVEKNNDTITLENIY